MVTPKDAKTELTTGKGFVKLEGLLSAQQADHIRNLLLSKVAGARENEPGVMHVGNLVSLGDDFTNLVTHPDLLAVAHHLLGPDAVLGACSGRILMPDCQRGGLHVDYPYWAMPQGMPVDPALMMQVIWMMEPFSSTNGGTWVAPGSQLWPARPDQSRFSDHAVQITGNPGDALVSHGLLWHQTAQNHATAPRVAVLINYTQLTIKPMAPLGPFSNEFKDQASPELRRLLDFDHGKALRARLKKISHA